MKRTIFAAALVGLVAGCGGQAAPTVTQPGSGVNKASETPMEIKAPVMATKGNSKAAPGNNLTPE